MSVRQTESARDHVPRPASTLRVRTRLILLVGALTFWLAAAVLITLVVIPVATRIWPIVIFGVGAVASIGGLILYWAIATEIDFLRCGYRIVRRGPKLARGELGPSSWVYEEVDSDGRLREFPFVRIFLDRGYPARSNVLVPGETVWDAQVPVWAIGRRAEILERILKSAGSTTTDVLAAA